MGRGDEVGSAAGAGSRCVQPLSSPRIPTLPLGPGLLLVAPQTQSVLLPLDTDGMGVLGSLGWWFCTQHPSESPQLLFAVLITSATSDLGAALEAVQCFLAASAAPHAGWVPCEISLCLPGIPLDF